MWYWLNSRCLLLVFLFSDYFELSDFIGAADLVCSTFSTWSLLSKDALPVVVDLLPSFINIFKMYLTVYHFVSSFFKYFANQVIATLDLHMAWLVTTVTLQQCFCIWCLVGQNENVSQYIFQSESFWRLVCLESC